VTRTDDKDAALRSVERFLAQQLEYMEQEFLVDTSSLGRLKRLLAKVRRAM
jgi:hypothetical protein